MTDLLPQTYWKKPLLDLVLLDIMLPGASGYDVLEYIKPLKIPVIFITAKNSLNDRVMGLKMGAEDYIVKPFEIVELLARIEVVLRRYNKLNTTITVRDLVIDTVAMSVTKNGKEIPLTNKEYELLLLFAQNPGVALYRETIYERIWGGDYPCDSRTVALHVQRMRKTRTGRLLKDHQQDRIPSGDLKRSFYEI